MPNALQHLQTDVTPKPHGSAKRNHRLSAPEPLSAQLREVLQPHLSPVAGDSVGISAANTSGRSKHRLCSKDPSHGP